MKIKNQIATYVSLLLSPVVVLPIAFLLRCYQRLSVTQFATTGLVTLLTVGLITGFYMYLRPTKKISDLHITKRRERTPINLFVLFCLGLGYMVARWLVVPELVSLLFYLTVWFAVFTGVTFVWKISAHTAAVTLAAFLLATEIPSWLIFSSLILVVAWSRVHLKNHTPAQVVGGIVLSLGVSYFFQL